MRASTAQLRRRIITIFIAAGTVVFAVLWLVESAAGIIAPIDHIGYPLIILFLSAGLLAMAVLPRSQPAVELVCYLGVAIYLLLQIWVFLFSAEDSNRYAIANTLLWMPVIHVAAFVFFPLRRAIFAAGGTFLASGLILVSAALFGPGEPMAPEVKALFLNALCAQLLVLLCLSVVTALRRQVEQVTRLARVMESAANTDRLTGIANRRGLEQLLPADDDTSGAPLTLILFDIDHFKSVNDRFGHLMGDEVLAATARMIESQLRPGHRVGRWGGEEFLVVTPGQSMAAAMNLADRVRRAVGGFEHEVVGRVTLSAGIATWNGDTPIIEAFRAADMALSAAKASGRNRVEANS